MSYTELNMSKQELRLALLPHAVTMLCSSDHFLSVRNSQTLAKIVDELVSVVTSEAEVVNDPSN